MPFDAIDLNTWKLVIGLVMLIPMLFGMSICVGLIATRAEDRAAAWSAIPAFLTGMLFFLNVSATTFLDWRPQTEAVECEVSRAYGVDIPKGSFLRMLVISDETEADFTVDADNDSTVKYRAVEHDSVIILYRNIGDEYEKMSLVPENQREQKNCASGDSMENP